MLKRLVITISWLTSSLLGGPTVLQNISLSITPICSISTSGSPSLLSVQLNSAGTASAQDTSTTYTIISNSTSKNKLKITGAIDANMPSNTTLKISLNSISGKSAGMQPLSTNAVDLVTKISSSTLETAAISYTFSVTNGFSIPAQTIVRQVTLTLTDG